MNKQEKAVELFNKLNCNQSVLSVFGPEYGIPENLCLSLGLSFGGGMGRQGKTCGVVTAAYMIIGLWATQQSADLQEQKKIAMEKVKEYNIQFLQQNSYLECNDLLGYDIGNPEGSEKIRELNLFNITCPNLIGSSVKILSLILT